MPSIATIYFILYTLCHQVLPRCPPLPALPCRLPLARRGTLGGAGAGLDSCRRNFAGATLRVVLFTGDTFYRWYFLQVVLYTWYFTDGTFTGGTVHVVLYGWYLTGGTFFLTGGDFLTVGTGIGEWDVHPPGRSASS